MIDFHEYFFDFGQETGFENFYIYDDYFPHKIYPSTHTTTVQMPYCFKILVDQMLRKLDIFQCNFEIKSQFYVKFLRQKICLK